MRLWGGLRVLTAFVVVAGFAMASPASAVDRSTPHRPRVADLMGDTTQSCVEQGGGQVGCVRRSAPDPQAPPPQVSREPAPAAAVSPRWTVARSVATRSVSVNQASAEPAVPVVNFPSWCRKYGTTLGSRTEVCMVEKVTYTTYRRIGEVQVNKTGELEITAYNYAYTNPDLAVWADQIGLVPEGGWGDALDGQVTGSAMVQAGEKCAVHDGGGFPQQSLAPLDGRHRVGTVLARTTVSAQGTSGICPLRWKLNFTTPNSINSPSVTFYMNSIQCDNLIPANGFRPRRIGCVAYRFIPTMVYSMTTHPNLARHIQLAQVSGLPGSPGTTPLTRKTNQGLIDESRRLACGKAPKIPGMSCDEYPMASTREGLQFGLPGTRRSHDGCYHPDLPTTDTGPRGVSVCMIPIAEQNAQGGIMAGFYYENRVQDYQRFWVHVGP